MLDAGEPKHILLSKRSQAQNIAYLCAPDYKFKETESRLVVAYDMGWVGAGKLVANGHEGAFGGSICSGTNPIGKGSALTSVFPKASLPNTATLKIRFQH